ncbi:MAG: hypothetical protein MUE51_00195 [Thermoleophilia bacterium]|jgi:hypothetical protein|nr:hypothetical protein [Thermoleophilia bacterium]
MEPVTALLIVLGAGIGPVAVGDERAVVESRVGPGVVVARLPPERGGIPLPGERVRYRRAGLVVTFPTPEASSGARVVATADPRYRTRRGAGAGTARAALAAAHPVRCRPAACLVTRRAPGRLEVTRFALGPDGRVGEVTVTRRPR